MDDTEMDDTEYGIKHAKEVFDALQGAPITTSLLAKLLRNARQDGRVHSYMKILDRLSKDAE